MSTTYDADVIVVGSGVLGSVAAHSLVTAGKSVIILEAGPRVPRWKIVENYRNRPNKLDYNAPYPDQPWAPKSSGGPYADDYLQNVGPFTLKPGMLRLVGGTTWHYAGAAWRYIPNDFKIRTLYGVGRDWPIDYDDLEPWYQLAEEAMGVSGSETDDQSGQGGAPFPPRSKPYPMPMRPWTHYTKRLSETFSAAGHHFIDEPNSTNSQPYDGRPACSGNNNCMPICPIGALYSGEVHAYKAERAGAKLLENSVAWKLEKGAGGKIVAVHYKSPEGKSTRITAKYFIVAAHGVETPKLLLMSEVANSSDQVGRNLMDHTGIALNMLTKEALWPGQGPVQQGGIFDRRDGEHRRQYAAIKHSPRNGIANQLVTEPLLEEGLMGSELDRRIRHDAARFVEISTTFEILPLPQNRITLSPKKDAIGLPKPQIYYDVDDYFRTAVDVAKQDYQRFVKLFEAKLLDDDSGPQNRDHIMGTVIMGSDPADSVVDGDCRTHDHPNLFLATTGVIPASGVINPTLTGAALALRAADVIRREI
ncbi:GMC family oxidoreductase [Lysobacter ciconiae]|uniref:GMC family oxidoreductase n=1 Tax=Novilysobacter ciconiae TaxID=2781022 RepID=A0A7S6UHY6_9GAMM|nr:GMC family oxidoreductase [Lysobacter ciconiae]QOW20590.1 GMC family oxidoreductase [Lysobacter ciconiae]